MVRRAALEQEVRRRLARHGEEMLRQLPLTNESFGARADGIRLTADGSLQAMLTLRGAHGVESTVTLRAEPGGQVEEYARAEREPDVVAPIQTRDESDERLGIVTALARKHLPIGAAEDFLAMLRPALRLVRAGEGEPAVAQLGGLPTLPVNSWPVWEGHGPLGHVLSFDCAPIAAMLPELGLPADGRLAFFYFDDRYDDAESTVGSWDPASRPGFRVLHLHPELSTRANITDAATPVPPGLTPFPVVALAAVRTVTWPSHETPMAAAVWNRHGLAGPRPGVAAPPVEALYDDLWKLPGGGYNTHQIGGHPCPQQGPVEMEVEQLRRGLVGEPFDWNDPSVQSAASGWQLLLQVASEDDADMMWGDVGQLYYLVQDAQQPHDALFTWQCG
ncbi:YwqG family protein [Kribbella sp. NPDC058245]|uniref:YwqG family protein n=1 Tax=Kribbella sp. NPDC058245 TaxID=3346399 RepID=UPI0036E28323